MPEAGRSQEKSTTVAEKNSDGSRIVVPPTAQFGDNGPTADTLEAAAPTTAPGQQAQVQPYWTGLNLKDWERSNLAVLVEKMDKLTRSFKVAFKDTPLIYAPLCISAQKDTSSAPIRLKISIEEPFPTEPVRKFLEDKYGPELAQSDFYEAFGLNAATVPLAELIKSQTYFRELDVFFWFPGRRLPIRNYPYQILLALPPETRLFFTGAIQMKEQGTEFDVGEESESFAKVLEVRDVIEYAKQVGELAQAKKYYDMYKAA